MEDSRSQEATRAAGQFPEEVSFDSDSNDFKPVEKDTDASAESLEAKAPDAAQEKEFVAEEVLVEDPETARLQKELESKLDEIQIYLDRLDRPQDAVDRNDAFNKGVERHTKSLLPEWKMTYNLLPSALKANTDGRDLALKIKIVEDCLRRSELINELQPKLDPNK